MLGSGRSIQYDYDAAGNVTSVTDIPATGAGQANRTTLTGYDELNRPVRVAAPQYTDATYGLICPVTVYSYDSLGRMTQVLAGRTPSPCSNAASDVTTLQMTYAFDDFGRRIRQTDALGKVWTYSYDANNNLQTATDAKSQTTSYTWNPGHQLASRKVGSDSTSGRPRSARTGTSLERIPRLPRFYMPDLPLHALQRGIDRTPVFGGPDNGSRV